MSKKGKRKKGNTGSPPPRSRPSLPDVGGAPSAPSSRAAVAAPSSSVSVSTSASSSSAATPTTRAPSHTDVLVGTTSESSAAEALAAAPAPSDVPPRDDHQEESGPRIVAFASEKTDKIEKIEKAGKPAKAEAKPQKAEPKPEKAEKSAKTDKAEKKPASAVELDHESFFEAGEKADKEHRAVARGVIPVDPHHEEDLALKHKMSPAVRERRARFTKYVKWAVGASAIVCLAALVRVTVARGQHGTENLAGGSQATEIAQAETLAPPPPVPEPTVAATPPTPSPAPTDTATAPPTDTATPAPADTVTPAAATTAAAAADTPTDPAAAKEEKTAARKALERGDLKGAIEAGERSVAYDPTDGDAWLLLGAAYQEKGKGADAKRAFTACLKQGKRGAVGECAAMLR